MQYRSEIDGLRAFAVIPVILFHAGFEGFSGGFLGVDIFFVISGYLITLIILEELTLGSFSLSNFYERRLRRIFPALIFVLLICLPLSWYLLIASDMRLFSASLISVLTFTANFYFWKVSSGYFDIEAEMMPLLHTWSLSLEEQFYLIFPIILILVWKCCRKFVIPLLSVMAILSFLLAVWGGIVKPVPSFFLLPTRYWELLMGAFVAFYLHNNNRRYANNYLSALGVLLICVSLFTYNKSSMPFPGLFTLLPASGTILVIIFATKDTLVGRYLGSRAVSGIGLISYSAYLWHQPLFAFFKYRYGEHLDPYVSLAIVLLTLLIAFLSWKYIETPFRNRKNINTRVFLIFCFLSSLFVVLFGIIGVITNGFLFRHGEGDRAIASMNKKDLGAYVEKRFNALQFDKFNNIDGNRKILIIGDSYARDLVNAIAENNAFSDVEIVTKYISVRCGNLFINRDRFSNFIVGADIYECKNYDLWKDGALRNLMLSADEIWLSSAWKPWQAELVRESVDNIKKFSSKPVKVFGRKDFGEINVKALIQLPVNERIKANGLAHIDTLNVNAMLEKNLDSTNYIDVQKIICKGRKYDNSCPLFDGDGNILSFDGGHLTKAGAVYYGKKLSEGGLLRTGLE